MENKPQKRFGQNFLTNNLIAQIIVSSLGLDKNDPILEIGPGRGALTQYLVNEYDNLTVCEIDKNLIENLNENYPTVKVLNKNILKADLTSYKGIIGNLPYNITTELFVKIQKNATSAVKMVFMIQKEAYERIIVAQKREEVTPTSIIFHTFYKQKFLLNVSRNNFDPKPNVDSVVFSLERNKFQPGFDISSYYYFLLILFSMRRKNILNNLIKKYDKEKVTEVLNELNISPNARSETLLLDQFYALYLAFNR